MPQPQLSLRRISVRAYSQLAVAPLISSAATALRASLPALWVVVIYAKLENQNSHSIPLAVHPSALIGDLETSGWLRIWGIMNLVRPRLAVFLSHLVDHSDSGDAGHLPMWQNRANREEWTFNTVSCIIDSRRKSYVFLFSVATCDVRDASRPDALLHVLVSSSIREAGSWLRWRSWIFHHIEVTVWGYR